MRSVLATVVGFVVWSVIWVGTNAIALQVAPDGFRGDGAVTSLGLLLVFLGASVVCSLVAGWWTAKLSKTGAARNVLVLAVILLAVGIAVQIGSWALLPVWYHLIFLALLVPATIAGGRLVRR